MSKTGIIGGYIVKCNNVINGKDTEMAKKLINEIVGVYGNEIANITECLDTYSTLMTTVYSDDKNVDYIGDIELLKAKLSNYRSDLKRGLDISKNSAKTNININNSPTANAIVTVNITNTIEQTIKDINKLEETELTKADKEELEDKLTALEKAVNTNDEEKAISKYMNILSFIIDKGPKAVLLITKCLGFIADKVQDLIK